MTRRHNELFKMPNDVFNGQLTATELMVLAAVYSLRSRSVYKGRKYVKVNQQTIASICGIKTTKTVSKAIGKLCRLGYIMRIDRYHDGINRLGSYVYTIPEIKGRAFFFVSRRIFKFQLSAAQTRMFLFFCKCADSRSKRFWNSYNDICRSLGLKRSAVIKTVSELIKIGLIKRYKVTKRNGSYSDNHYKVMIWKMPKRKIKRKKRRSRFALGFSHLDICVKLFYSYIIKHKSKNVNTLRIYFFDLRGSPKIYCSLLVPTFDTNRKKKRNRLYLKYRCNLRLCDFHG